MTGPRGLVRRSGRLRDARLVVIATEGERTEPAYFAALQAHGLVDARVILRVAPPADNASAPQAVLATAKDARQGFGAVQTFDQVWCVVDVDHRTRAPHISGFLQTLKEADEAGIAVAVSNPCFEIWYLLHHADLPGEDLPDYSAVQAACASAIPEPRLEGGVPRACVARVSVDAAVARARAGDDVTSPWPQKPGTQLHRLVSDLLA